MGKFMICLNKIKCCVINQNEHNFTGCSTDSDCTSTSGSTTHCPMCNTETGNCVGKYEPRCERPGLRGFRPGPTQSGLYSHSRRWLEAEKFQIYVVEGLYYPYSENKGADQLRSYCAADLRLCFRICKKPVFS